MIDEDTRPGKLELAFVDLSRRDPVCDESAAAALDHDRLGVNRDRAGTLSEPWQLTLDPAPARGATGAESGVCAD